MKKNKLSIFSLVGLYFICLGAQADTMGSLQNVVMAMSKTVEASACEKKLKVNSARMGDSFVVQLPDGTLRVYGKDKKIFAIREGKGCEAKSEDDYVKIGSNQKIGDPSHYLDSVISSSLKSITASKAAEIFKECKNELSGNASEEMRKKLASLDYPELSELGLNCSDSPYSRECQQISDSINKKKSSHDAPGPGGGNNDSDDAR